jgi:hypothetical protein
MQRNTAKNHLPTTKESNRTIQKEIIWRYTNMEPAPPSLHATIKLHKSNTPIKPVINCRRNAPAHELAKQLAETLDNHLRVPYTYNIQNTKQLITELKTIEISKDTRICSFDIENMYTNIPKTEATNIIANILKINSTIKENSQKK